MTTENDTLTHLVAALYHDRIQLGHISARFQSIEGIKINTFRGKDHI